MSRPSLYSQDLADAICERIADGESLRAICADEGMPGRTTVWRWLEASEAFRNQYARAREAQAESLADDIVTIADDGRNDTWLDDAGNRVNMPDVIARSKLRVDARKWILSKLKPGTYGDKVETTHRGGVEVSGTLQIVGVAPNR
jgi:hypothetical protein